MKPNRHTSRIGFWSSGIIFEKKNSEAFVSVYMNRIRVMSESISAPPFLSSYNDVQLMIMKETNHYSFPERNKIWR